MFSFSGISSVLLSGILILLIFLIVLFFVVFYKKNNAIKKMNDFINKINKLNKNLDTDSINSVKISIYSEEFTSKIKMKDIIVPAKPILNNIIIISEVMDIKKAFMDQPYEKDKSTLLYEDNMFKFNSWSLNINNIAYIRGHFEINKQALFIEFVTYESNCELLLQIDSIEGIIWLNNKILKYRKS